MTQIRSCLIIIPIFPFQPVSSIWFIESFPTSNFTVPIKGHSRRSNRSTKYVLSIQNHTDCGFSFCLQSFQICSPFIRNITHRITWPQWWIHRQLCRRSAQAHRMPAPTPPAAWPNTMTSTRSIPAIRRTAITGRMATTTISISRRARYKHRTKLRTRQQHLHRRRHTARRRCSSIRRCTRRSTKIRFTCTCTAVPTKSANT